MNHPVNLAFNDIYTTYYRKSFLFAKSYVHNDWVAEDIASESLIKLWNKLKEEEIANIELLLLTILKNLALDYLKHEKIKTNVLEAINGWQQYELTTRITALEACDPQETFSEEIRQIVGETLKELPKQTRYIFILSRFQNKSNKEIAELTGISVKGVEYHITKALKVLRIALKDYLPFLLLTGLGHLFRN